MIPKNTSPARTVAKFKELARSVVEHHFGTRPRRVEFKASGLTNFVFAFKVDREAYIVRISPEAAAVNSFIKEQWTQRAAQKAGVPTAEILEVGSSVIPFPYMITRQAIGHEAALHPKRLEIIQELGRLAAKINQVRTKGFGTTFDWSNNLLSRNHSWKEYLETEYNFEGKLETLEKRKFVGSTQIKLLRKIFREASGYRAKPALNHGDLRLKNVLVDENGKITAVIDWENATSNLAPHWELSLALHDLNIDEMQRFIQGYGIDHKKLEAAAPLIKAFNMLNYIPEIDRVLSAKDKVGIERIRARFAGTFDLYSLR